MAEKDKNFIKNKTKTKKTHKKNTKKMHFRNTKELINVLVWNIQLTHYNISYRI